MIIPAVAIVPGRCGGHRAGVLRWIGIRALALMTSSSACAARVIYTPPPEPAPVERAAEDTRQVVDDASWAERVLPAVVLILNRRTDGTTHYGAGILLDDSGGILTSTHVVAGAESLGAMLYDATRVSYTALDGGLTRYLEENRAAVLEARIERSDPELDLTVVRIPADTSRYPKLDFRADPPHPGERVMALGHPGESVWSVTSGIVSSLHQGAIQHDAAIHDGNSGGPLIDARGRIIGINTAKLMNGAERVEFARPIAMAKHLLEKPATRQGGSCPTRGLGGYSPGGASLRGASSPGK